MSVVDKRPIGWNLWVRQAAAVAKFELTRFLLARRWVGVYFLAFAPVLLMYLRSRVPFRGGDVTAEVTQNFATMFQFFTLQFGVFIGSAVVFSQLFRGDILEKTLHFYLLAAARREVITAGKYVAGVVFVGSLFGFSTACAHLIGYSANGGFSTFFLEGPGFAHLFRYVGVVVLATIVYGALFLLLGAVSKNPGVPIFFLWGWESFSFALPSVLQRLSIVYYLRPILPVNLDRGAFAIVIDPVSPVLGIPIVLVAAAVLLALSGLFVRSTQITYSAE